VLRFRNVILQYYNATLTYKAHITQHILHKLHIFTLGDVSNTSEQASLGLTDYDVRCVSVHADAQLVATNNESLEQHK
jgi:hypothetical protein